MKHYLTILICFFYFDYSHAGLEEPLSINEDAEVTQLQRLFTLQSGDYKTNPYPSYEERLEDLKTLRKMVVKYKDQISQAISADFVYRSPGDTATGDMLGTLGGIDYCIENLENWMEPEERHVDLKFKPSTNYVMYQPKGVVGIISCWNYPVFESFGHLAWVIAAGNRCIIKGSEFVPNTNRVSREAVKEFFPESKLGFVEGAVKVGSAFTALPFNHILMTGSPKIGKIVMRAAADNLTPVTLELGGKSPLIIDSEFSIKDSVNRFMLGKVMNAGQTCVATDYIFCPKERIEELKTEISRRYSEMYPNFRENKDWTHIANDRQYQRIVGLLDDAQNKGATVEPLAEIDRAEQDASRKMPLHILTDLNKDMDIMNEEIFGPLLPILPYSHPDEVISHIQDHPRPLGLYIHSDDTEFQEKILHNTHSGGVCINQATFHVAQEDLPFGGTGNSGMGRIHGPEGVKTFSNVKAVHHKGDLDLSRAFSPPYGWISWFIHKLLLR